MISNLFRNRTFLLIAACLLFCGSLCYFVSTAYATRNVWVGSDDSSYSLTGGAVLDTTAGQIKIEFLTAEAPNTVKNFITLANEGFYDGTKFHRVVKGFMIQGGDPNSKNSDESLWGQGGPGYTFADEINDEPMVRGIVAMANKGPNTNGSQFFILTEDSAAWLQGQYTVFGTVTSGMDVADTISDGPVEADGQTPINPVTVNKVYLTP